MTDHIIKAAKDADIEFQQNRGVTGRITTATLGSQPIEKMERFYTLAYRAGLERAAKVCEDYAKHMLAKEMPIAYVYVAKDCATAIRALGEQQ